MTGVFIATLGQRPEAITIAFDLLRERSAVENIAILWTAGIAEAAGMLQKVITADYPAGCATWHEITLRDSSPMQDILTPDMANAYWRGVYGALRYYKAQGRTLHLLIAGGRKAMSIYATLAAALVFSGNDRLWTVLSPDSVVDARVFHVPPEQRSAVYLVEMPLLPARIPPGGVPAAVLENPQLILDQRESLRVNFLNRLTAQERQVADMLAQFPYDTTQTIAEYLHKSPRTVERQLSDIYAKMSDAYDFVDQISDKRQALINIMLGR